VTKEEILSTIKLLRFQQEALQREIKFFEQLLSECVELPGVEQ